MVFLDSIQGIENSHVLGGSCVGVISGVVILCVGIYWARLGMVWDNIWGWSSRAERPVVFWIELSSVFVISAHLVIFYGFRLIKYLLN